MAEMIITVAGKGAWFHYGAGVSHSELRDDLEKSRGQPVAVGLYPPWLDGPPNVVHAVVPDSDGVVRAGPY